MGKFLKVFFNPLHLTIPLPLSHRSWLLRAELCAAAQPKQSRPELSDKELVVRVVWWKHPQCNAAFRSPKE